MIEEETTAETDTAESTPEVEETKTDVEEFNEPNEGESDDSNIEKPEEGETDYKAQLEAERLKREKAEKALADQAYKDREAKRKAEDDEPEDSDDGTMSKDQVKQLIAQGAAQAKKESFLYEAGRIASQLSTSEDEKTLIMMKWQGMSFNESTPLGEQIEDAMVLVNKKKMIGERNEALRTLSSRNSANRDGSGSRGSEGTSKAGAKLDSGDKQVLSDAGLTYNTSTRRYEKKLGSGKIQYYDTNEKKLKVSA